MSRWSLRSRLAAASAVAVLVALAVLGGAATLVVEDQLRGTVDRELKRRAVDVAQLAAVTPDLLQSRGALDLGSGGRQVWVEVRDRDGRIVARSDALRGRLLPGDAARAAALRDARPGFADDRLGDEPIRLYAAPLADTGGVAGGGTVVVASSMGDIEAIFTRLREAIAVAALAAALLGGLLATVLTRRGLRPLRRLATGASAISEAPDPGRRLPAAATRDELGDLSGALNRMLDALDRAREAERRLLADASHELRTPVTSLRGNAAFARRHGADAELLADLEADAERLARLVDDLLALEREAGAERPDAEVDLEAVIAAVVAAPEHQLDADELLGALAADADREAPRVVVTATAPLAVRGQAGPLERALRNLVENACVHGPAGGEVRVALARRGGEAVLSVSDDGPGIPRALADAAPRRFWRGPDAAGRPGSGLGLAIVTATAARHGGRLEIDGATVAIVLPLVRELSRPARTLAP
jgi:signal transduction histidine kinase